MSEDDELQDWGERRGVLGPIVAIAGFIAALGLIPMTLGFGPFGLRVLTGETIDVHVLNLSGEDLVVSLSFSEPHPVTAGTMETLSTLSGRSQLVSTRPDGSVLDEIELDAAGAVFYNAGGGRCFAVFDLSDFYGGGDDARLQVVARLGEDTRAYEFDADTVVLPRRVAPANARGVVHWIEPVGCNLLEPEEEPFLLGQNRVRLEQRRERYEENLRQAREAVQGR